MATLKRIGRATDSILSRIEVTDINDAQAEALGSVLRKFKRDGNTITANASRQEIIWAQTQLARFATKPSNPIPASPSATGARRHIELAANVPAGANKGRAWIASAYNVDQHSLPPEWEGEYICYVYQEGK